MGLERPYWLLMGQAVLMQACYFSVRPMVSYRALDQGATTSQLGIIAAAFGVLSLFAAIPVGRLVDRVGPGRMTITGVTAVLVGIAIAVLPASVTSLVVSGGVLGLGHVMAMAGHQTLVAARWPAARREKLYNHYSSYVSIGQAVGPPVGLFAAGHVHLGGGSVQGIDPLAGLVIAGVIALVALPAAVALRERDRFAGFRHRRPAVAPPPAADVEGLRSSWEVMATSAVVVAALDVLLAFLPAWAGAQQIAPFVVGWLLAARAASTLLIRLVAGRLVARLGRTNVLAGSIFCACLGFSVLPFVAAAPAFATMLLLGIGLGLAQPLTLVMLMDRTDPNAQGAAVGARLAGNRLGQVLLPLAMSGVAALSGVDFVWWATALVLSCCVALVLGRARA
jgi:MFS family permease